MSLPLLKDFLKKESEGIIKEPDERLLKISTDYVEKNPKDLIKLKKIMNKLMAEAHGIGLAAPQVGLNLNIILVSLLSGEKNEIRNKTLMVNPKIMERSGTNAILEGCLSVPGAEISVNRSRHISVEFLDEYLKVHKIDLTGINSICVQHEIDHLLGILFTTYLSTEENLLADKKINL